MAAVREINFHVARYNPETDREPYTKTYKVPVREGMTVLDGLHYIKDNLDPTLAWRYSCRMGVCGSCGMLLNGRPGLACNTQILHERLDGNPPLRVFTSEVRDAAIRAPFDGVVTDRKVSAGDTVQIGRELVRGVLGGLLGGGGRKTRR